jgi:hypothetical protein
MKVIILTALMMLAASITFSQDIYKWEDEKGVVHYGDMPTHPTAAPLEKDALPYSHTGSLPANSSSERKARTRKELDEARLEDTSRLASASPQLSRPKAWIDTNGRLRLSGSIRNRGKGLCDVPAVEVVIFDDKGSEDGVFETAALPTPLTHGEEARFDGEYFTPVGTALSWRAAPRCGAAEGTVYGAYKQGTLKIAHSRTVRPKRLRTR